MPSTSKFSAFEESCLKFHFVQSTEAWDMVTMTEAVSVDREAIFIENHDFEYAILHCSSSTMEGIPRRCACPF